MAVRFVLYPVDFFRVPRYRTIGVDLEVARTGQLDPLGEVEGQGKDLDEDLGRVLGARRITGDPHGRRK